jgi:hypothetical protein
MGNNKTANLYNKILNFVLENDYYPSDWFTLNEMLELYTTDKITIEEYDTFIDNLLIKWSK